MNPARTIKAHLDLCRAQMEAAESWRPVARESANKRIKKADQELIDARLAMWRAVLGRANG